MRRVLVFALLLLLTGCSVGHRTPGYVKCKGKGKITGAGNISIGYGGSNLFTLDVDCPDDGLEFSQGPVAPADAQK